MFQHLRHHRVESLSYLAEEALTALATLLKLALATEEAEEAADAALATLELAAAATLLAEADRLEAADEAEAVKEVMLATAEERTPDAEPVPVRVVDGRVTVSPAPSAPQNADRAGSPMAFSLSLQW